jgi:hypothetical protein
MTSFSSSRSLHRIVYFSRSLIPAGQLESQIDAIIRHAVVSNRASAITGLLFVHQGWFLQVLEGPATAVQTTLGRIDRDQRHEVRVIGAEAAEQRLFGDWDMCARTLSTVDEAVVDTLARRGPFEPAKLSLATATRLLSTLRTVRKGAQARQGADA